MEAKALVGVDAPRRELALRLHDLGASAVIVTTNASTPERLRSRMRNLRPLVPFPIEAQMDRTLTQ